MCDIKDPIGVKTTDHWTERKRHQVNSRRGSIIGSSTGMAGSSTEARFFPVSRHL